MKKILPLLLIFSLAACVSTKKYNYKLIVKHPINQLKTDLAIVKTSLEQAHPGLYWYISKEKLDFKFDSIQNSIKDSMPSLAFYKMVAPIVSEVKCGHTRLFYPKLKLSKKENNKEQKKGELPLKTLEYKVEDDKIFVVANKNKTLNGIKLGAQIISIDSVPVKQILANIKQLFTPDGYNLTFHNEVLNKVFSSYYYLAFAKKDSNLLVIKDSLGLRTVWLKPKKPKKEEERSKIKLTKQQKKEALAKKIFKHNNKYKGLDENQQPLLDFKIDTTLKNTAILKVKSFGLAYSSTNKFFKETFKSIAENKIENLVLDLRGNMGGNLFNNHLLFRYLYNKPHQFTGRADMKTRYFYNQKYIQKSFTEHILNIVTYPAIQLSIKKDSLGYYKKFTIKNDGKELKNHFDGNLTVLINGLSFSATSLLAANLQSVNRGYFIGEETGGGYNQCSGGTIPYIVLPNTGLKLRLPLVAVKIVKTRALVGRGVFPDLEIKQTIDDVLKGNDVVMEKAKNKIAENLK